MDKITIIGPCSKYVDGQGWTTEIPVHLLGSHLTKEDQQELLKFVSGEFVESNVLQRLLGISFEECMTRFVFARTAKWNKAPLNGQEIINYFKIPMVEKE